MPVMSMPVVVMRSTSGASLTVTPTNANRNIQVTLVDAEGATLTAEFEADDLEELVDRLGEMNTEI
jgi:hypothetical protein